MTPSERVIVMMRDQHPDLLTRTGAVRWARALDRDQLPLVRELKDSGARNLMACLGAYGPVRPEELAGLRR